MDCAPDDRAGGPDEVGHHGPLARAVSDSLEGIRQELRGYRYLIALLIVSQVLLVSMLSGAETELMGWGVSLATKSADSKEADVVEVIGEGLP